MTTLLCYKQPDNLESFLIEQIRARKEHGNRSIVYTDTELQNIFTLYDLKGAGHITKDQCKEGKSTKRTSCRVVTVDCGGRQSNYSARDLKSLIVCTLTKMSSVFLIALKTLANSEYHFSKAQDAVIPGKVDLFTFMKICDDVLGIKAQ